MAHHAATRMITGATQVETVYRCLVLSKALGRAQHHELVQAELGMVPVPANVPESLFQVRGHQQFRRSDLVDDEEEDEEGEDDEEEIAYDDTDSDSDEAEEEEVETEVAEARPTGPKPFTVVVHTSNGPIQYHFNQQSSFVPNRIEGYSASQNSTSWPVDNLQSYVDENKEEVESNDEEDEEDEDEDDDSDSLMDELDSEPRN